MHVVELVDGSHVTFVDTEMAADGTMGGCAPDAVVVRGRSVTTDQTPACMTHLTFQDQVDSCIHDVCQGPHGVTAQGHFEQLLAIIMGHDGVDGAAWPCLSWLCRSHNHTTRERVRCTQ